QILPARRSIVMVKTRLVCLFVLMFAAASTARADAPGFSRMWKGDALWAFLPQGGGKYAGSGDPKEWQSIPGVTISFTYSGKGLLPAPKEFVIKLDKPLSLGP